MSGSTHRVVVYSIVNPQVMDAPLCSCTRETVGAPVGPIVVLRVEGEIDLYTLAPLRTVLAEAVAGCCAPVVVDLAGVSFCAAAGFRLLADAALRATVDGAGFAVTGLSPTLGRHASLVWIEGLPVRYRGVVRAVRALRTTRSSHRGPTTNA